MKRLNVFADQKEIAYIKSRMNAPVMLIGGVDTSRPTAQEAAHKAALKHDLPEITGYYGIDLSTGEFVES